MRSRFKPEMWAKVAEEMGFLYVASGPLVRSSFKAGELLRSAAGKRLVRGLGGRIEMGKVASGGVRPDAAPMPAGV